MAAELVVPLLAPATGLCSLPLLPPSASIHDGLTGAVIDLSLVWSRSAFTLEVFGEREAHVAPCFLHGRNPQQLHGGVAGDRRETLEVLVATAPGAAPQRHAGRVVDVAHPGGWVLLTHIHQLLHQVAQAAAPQIQEQHLGLGFGL